MTLLAALALAAASARIETLAAVRLGDLPALRIALTGEPGAVALHYEDDRVHLVLTDTSLGSRFAGIDRSAWSAAADPAPPAWLSARAPWLGRIEIEHSAGVVQLAFVGPPGKAPELRSEPRALIVFFRREGGRPAVADRPTGAAHPQGPPPSVAELLPRLFPGGRAAAPGPTVAGVETPQLDDDLGLGPLRLRAGIDARYVNADTFVGRGAESTRDEFLELAPQLAVRLPLGAGRLGVHYRPALRAFASYAQINRSNHTLGLDADLSVGQRLRLQLRDNFVAGTLETRVADPGGEYFSGLGRFQRHDLSGAASIRLGSRTSLELSAAGGELRFSEETSFFGYESRAASAGLGFELTPRLRAIASYVHDRVPRPRERPEAESRAHSARLSLSGDLLPRLSGEVSASYRSQRNPGAGEAGRRYSGLTLSGSLTRELTPLAGVSLLASRSTPPSAYEANGFYVSSSLQASAVAPLPLALQLRCGLGGQRNAYRVAAAGALRSDRLLGWFVSLRRPLARRLFLAATYRAERRRSNLDLFAARTSGFVAQLEWDALGAQR